MRPPLPVPVITETSKLFSATKRRTAGDNFAAGCAANLSSLVAGALDEAGADSSAAGAGAGAAAAGASSLVAGASSASSPSTAITQITSPTSALLPSSKLMAVITPSAGAGTSIAALSVSTSKRISFFLTSSPTFLYQAATVPSLTDSPIWGMITFTLNLF